MSGQTNELHPTFFGYIESTMDSLLLFEAALAGRLAHVARRPHDRERSDLIKSGNVFVYEEFSSGIKRWTDGVSWSPSRILDNFLLYRELDQPFAPGEKKRAMKRKKPSAGISKPGAGSQLALGGYSSPTARSRERTLVGSLIDSYPFKSHGLLKKTISINFQGIPHHLVSYYKIEDIDSGRLHRPTEMPWLQNCPPRAELTTQNFRVPLNEIVLRVENGHDRPRLLYVPASSLGEKTAGMEMVTSGPGFQAGLDAPYASHPYGPTYNGPNQYVAATTTAMGPPMLAHVPHPLPAPMPSPGVSSTQSMLPQSMNSGMQHPSGNYSLDHGRPIRHSPGSNVASEFPRNMPAEVSPLLAGPRDLYGPSNFSTTIPAASQRGLMPHDGSYIDNQHDNYLQNSRQPSMAMQDGQILPSLDRSLGPDATALETPNDAQQYNIGESGDQAWNFDEEAGNLQEQQYFASQLGSGSQQWHGNNDNNGVGR